VRSRGARQNPAKAPTRSRPRRHGDVRGHHARGVAMACRGHGEGDERPGLSTVRGARAGALGISTLRGRVQRQRGFGKAKALALRPTWVQDALKHGLLAVQGCSMAVPCSRSTGIPGPWHDAAASGDDGARVYESSSRHARARALGWTKATTRPRRAWCASGPDRGGVGLWQRFKATAGSCTRTRDGGPRPLWWVHRRPRHTGSRRVTGNGGGAHRSGSKGVGLGAAAS
jgi:hypothetical protein